MDLNTGDNHTRTTTDALKGDRNGTINHREMARQNTSLHDFLPSGQLQWPKILEDNTRIERRNEGWSHGGRRRTAQSKSAEASTKRRIN
jgi:hypothetical protein